MILILSILSLLVFLVLGIAEFHKWLSASSEKELYKNELLKREHFK